MQTLSDFYKSIFSCKAYKLSIDAGCTCPNRDGTKGRGGCIFCSENGSGDFVPSRLKTVSQQIEEAKFKVLSKAKGRSGKNECVFIAYFQNFTSTYGDADLLIQKYKEALNCPDVKGLAVATRPDCLNDKILCFLSELSQTTFVQLELGLQTSCETTGKLINRCYTNDDYIDAINKIRTKSEKIHIVTHLIFGLPGENESDFLNSVKFVKKVNGNLNQSGIKITVLYIVKNTVLAGLYENGKVKCLSEDEYFSSLEKALDILPDNFILHRLTGDPPKNILIAPQWPCDKKRVLSRLNQLLEKVCSR